MADTFQDPGYSVPTLPRHLHACRERSAHSSLHALQKDDPDISAGHLQNDYATSCSEAPDWSSEPIY